MLVILGDGFAGGSRTVSRPDRSKAKRQRSNTRQPGKFHHIHTNIARSGRKGDLEPAHICNPFQKLFVRDCPIGRKDRLLVA